MGKRKANIFTAAESVTNWFEASSHGLADIEINTGVTKQVGLGEGVGDQPQLVGPAVTGTEAGQLTPVDLQPVVEVDSRPTVD